jgi:NADPH2:quinone reductase
VRAVVYSEAGGPEVLRLVERPEPQPGAGEVRVSIAVSGVNPTDWRGRSGRSGPPLFPEIVPNQDGAGTIDLVGGGVDPARIGERVWLWEAGWRRPHGTAQESVVVPARQAVPLPDDASFDAGASLGIPALTAHRCLTVSELGPTRLHPGSLNGCKVLVAGGAGAVGHAAIQLAKWAGARVIATVSSQEKARLARAAGAFATIDYRATDAAEQVRAHAPDGVEIVVEVAPEVNAALDCAVLAPGGVVAVYASQSGGFRLSTRDLMARNLRYQFVLVFTVPKVAKDGAVQDVAAAVADGALPVGEQAGLPLHRYPLEQAGAAHAAVEASAVGKVLIDVARDGRSA